jgi:stage II sporulation protein D
MTGSRSMPARGGRRGPSPTPASLTTLVVAVLLALSATTALAIEPVDPGTTAASPSPGPTRGTGVARTVTIGTDATVTATPTPSPTASPTPTPTPGTTVPVSGSITFHGRGWGHGVGLSQYGARGRALAGQTAEQILAHYYQGATFGTMDPAMPIRVLVLSGWGATATAPLTVYGRVTHWTIDGIEATFPVGAKLTVTPVVVGTDAVWRATVTSAEGTVLHDGPAGTALSVRAGAAGTLELSSKPSAYDVFRGVLNVSLSSTTSTASVVNTLGIDEYLRGVVPAEVSSTWPTETLKAQTVAARSYAAYRLRSTSWTFDVYDDTRSQVYRGYLVEKATTNAVIAAAPGAVMYSEGKYVNALFHSAGGGATEHNENVFVSSTGARTSSPVSYLRGSSDRAPDGSAYDAASPYATWKTNTYTITQVSGWFAADSRTNVGTLTALDLSHRGVSGRLYRVILIGTAGTKTVSADVFRSVFNAGRPSSDPSFRSNLFDLAPIP